MPLLSRVAENLFWTSRYLERATAILQIADFTAGARSGPDLEPAELDPSFAMTDDPQVALMFYSEKPGSVLSCVRSAREAAREIRETLSRDMWEHLNTLFRELSAARVADDVAADLSGFSQVVRSRLLLLNAIADDTLCHDDAWQFLRLGRCLERADNLLRLLHACVPLWSRDAAPGDDAAKEQWLRILRALRAEHAYIRFYSPRLDRRRVFDLLLLNPVFPRSVRCSVADATVGLESIASTSGTTNGCDSPSVEKVSAVKTRLETTTIEEVVTYGLTAFLTEVQQDINRVSDAVASEYFSF